MMAKKRSHIVRFVDAEVPAVVQSTKKQTIRRGRKFNHGDRMYLYPVGRGRTRLRSALCEDVRDIHITGNGVVIIDDHVLMDFEKHQLAVDDGFEDFKHFMHYFKKGKLPLKGQLVKWM